MDQNEPKINLREVCRTCLLTSKNMLSIFSSIQVPHLKLKQLLDLLNIFTEISVSPNDAFPDKICSDCVDQLHQTFAFKVKCENSEAIIRQLKVDGLTANELESTPYAYKHYSEVSVALIKTEITGNYETICDENFDEKLRHELAKQEISIVQEVKQEPEIELRAEDDCTKTDSNNIEPLAIKTEKPLYKCDHCSKEYAYPTDLTVHTLLFHPAEHVANDSTNCDICSAQFSERFQLIKHMKTHANHYPCPLCSRIFDRKYSLQCHIISHSNEKEFKCENCSKLFRYKKDLSVHMQLEHTDESVNSKFKCTTCSTSFEHKSVLKKHMRIHTVERQSDSDKTTIKVQHICPICSKVFKTRTTLTRHQVVHADEIPYQCNICSKKCRFKSNLKAHMRMKHDDETTNKIRCPVCSKVCLSKCDLDRHMIVHTQEKPYQCEICQMRFRYTNSLKNHERKAHIDGTSKEKPIHCKLCPKRFADKRNLRAHMRRFHGITRNSEAKGVKNDSN